jgi:glutaredoxin
MYCVTLYAEESCEASTNIRLFLKKKGAVVRDVVVNRNTGSVKTLGNRASSNSLPQIFIGLVRVGGLDELVRLDSMGMLDSLLRSGGICHWDR